MWTTIFELVCRTKSHIKQSYRSVFLKTVLKRRLTVACIALKKILFFVGGGVGRESHRKPNYRRAAVVTSWGK